MTKNSHLRLKKPIVNMQIPCSIFASSKFYLNECMKYKTQNIKLTPLREKLRMENRSKNTVIPNILGPNEWVLCG